MPMKHHIIYNPNAANGTAEKKADYVRSLFDDAGLEYSMEFTEGPGHAESLAQENARNHEVLVAAGGDGTANEVINGIMRASQPPSSSTNVPAMGVLCVGRGNDFAFGAGIPSKLPEAVDVLSQDYRKTIDTGYISGPEAPKGRYFGNGIGIGFDTIVGLEARKIKWAQGFLGYLLGALKTMFFYYSAIPLTLDSDGRKDARPMLQISAMNGRRMGGAFYMAPEAANDDGYFDICIAGEPKRREMLGVILQFLKGSQAGNRHITFDRAKKIVVTSSDGKIVMHADGETICTEGREVVVEIVPGALSVVSTPPPT